MAISPTDSLRLLNLAYFQMQGDMKRIFPDLFRQDQTLTSNASGYILPAASTFEVENIVFSSTKEPLEQISKGAMYQDTGWYHDGADQTAGKLRIMIRKAGAAHPSVSVILSGLNEYPALQSLDAIPYPFVQERYLNMLTELQAAMLFIEGGKESEQQLNKHWNMYQFLLEQAKKDSFTKVPQFIGDVSNDAGGGLGRRSLRTA